MRIIAGEFRGRSLLPPPGAKTRPITDRAKESLFSKLGGFGVAERVLDVFAGTGSMGLETLSRGASRAIFIERDANAFGRLRRNVERLGIGPSVFLWQTDAFRCSFRPQNQDEFLPYDLVFFDPPFRIAEEMSGSRPLARALTRLLRPELTTPDARCVVRTPESPASSEFRPPEGWKVVDRSRFGAMSLSICVKQPAEGE